MKNFQWSDEETATLVAMRKEDPNCDFEVIAKVLDRTKSSVKERWRWITRGSEILQARKERRNKPWTDEDIETARRMLKEKAPAHKFLEVLGRTQHCCYAKMDRLRYIETRSGPILSPKVIPSPKVPDEVWEDAQRRAIAPRSLTAILMGDPEPGRARL